MFINVFNSVLKQNKASKQNREREGERKRERNLWLDTNYLWQKVIHNFYFYFMFLSLKIIMTNASI